MVLLVSLLPAERAEEGAIRGVEGGAGEEVGAAFEREAQRLLAAPAGDGGVLAGEQDVGHADAAELLGAGVLRMLEEPRREGVGGGDVLDGGDQRLGFHHHALPAAVGCVVHLKVAAARIVAELVERDLEGAALAGAAQDAGRERGAEHLGKEREDVDAHGVQSRRPGGGSITTRRPARSIARTTSATTGIRCSRSAVRTTQTSLAPVASVATSVPSCSPPAVSTRKPTTS